MQPIRRYLTCHSDPAVAGEESRIKFGPFHQGKIDRDVSLAQHDSAICDMGLCFAARLPSKIGEPIFYELDNHRPGEASCDFEHRQGKAGFDQLLF